MSVSFLNTFTAYVAFHNLALAFHLDRGFADWAINFSLWVNKSFSFLVDNAELRILIKWECQLSYQLILLTLKMISHWKLNLD